MDKEHASKVLNVMIYPSLYDQFAVECKNNYRTVSEVVRELMTEYVRRQKEKKHEQEK
jgi:hypothetical protein